ncbi:MAG: hypothetical protein ACE5ED_06390 [Rhodothalassiaceae bacterium]
MYIYPPTLAAKAQALEAYLAGEKYDPMVHARLAGEFFVAADYDGALEVLNEALDRLPATGASAAIARASLADAKAEIYRQKGDTRQRIEALQQARAGRASDIARPS